MNFEKNKFNHPIKEGGDEDEKIDLAKRATMKKLAALGAGALLGGGIVEAVKYFDSVGNNEEIEREKVEAMLKVTEEQLKIEREDAISLEENIDFRSDKEIRFNEQTTKSLENSYTNRYRGKLKRDLVNAYQEMGAYDKYLIEIFEKEGVPPEYRYIAIGESNFKMHATSEKAAVGPYQFIWETAKAYHMKKGENFDERRDPLISARACAKNLKDLYEKFNHDWNIALSGYNGGFVWDYHKEAKASGEPINYKNYLNFLERKLNEKKQHVKKRAELTHEIAKGETLSKIARTYGVSENELLKLNPGQVVKWRQLIAGKIINLPVTDDVRSKIYYREISGYKENINYPAKLYAIMKLIKGGEAGAVRKPTLKWTEEITVEPMATQAKATNYIFKKEDKNLYQLAKKFRVDVKEVLKANPGINPNRLGAGANIVIPAGKTVMKQPTLIEIAVREKCPPERIIALNYAVIDPRKPLPVGMKIRV